ncbi:unnamed protein product [Blepharisma stoltei]|uniref:Uncharacterized protein n=1 Tax=Blepharisma stoltei TaxID=1481888 RepID=A0AAU9IFB4_9CILI|nr:unnamed protein product [Blepharisma stoltei]
MRAILNRASNDIEIEKKLGESAWCMNQLYHSDPQLNKNFQDCIDTYHKITSLYLLSKDENSRTNLIIYDTESKREDWKVLTAPEELNYGTCITQLPCGELFVLGKIQLLGLH